MKRLISLLLSLLLIMCLFPFTCNMAAAYEDRVSIIIRSVSVDGILQNAKDGSIMYEKPLTVSDVDGVDGITINDAMLCLHQEYCPNGNDGYAASRTGTSNAGTISKAWGESNSGTIIFSCGSGKSLDKSQDLNSHKQLSSSNLFNTTSLVSGMVLAISVSTTQKNINQIPALMFFQGANANTYTSIRNLITAYAGESFSVKLSERKSSGQVATNVSVKIRKLENGVPVIDDYAMETTNSAGQVSFTINEPGDYLMMASKGTSASPMVALCEVTVLPDVPKTEDIQDLWISTEPYGTNLISGFNNSVKEYSITVPENYEYLYVAVTSEKNYESKVAWAAMNVDGTTTGIGNVTAVDYRIIETNPNKDARFSVTDASSMTALDIVLSAVESFGEFGKYRINIHRSAWLDDLVLSSDTLTSFDPSNNTLHTYIRNTDGSITITPKSEKNGLSVTVNGVEAAVNEAYTIETDALAFSNGLATIDVVVHREGIGYADNIYSIIAEKLAETVTPTFYAQPVSAKYVIGDPIQALSTYASAASAVTYQWYLSSENNTGSGIPITNATDNTYIPASNQSGTFYYYCKASAGAEDVFSSIAQIIIYSNPTPSGKWTMEIPKFSADEQQFVAEQLGDSGKRVFEGNGYSGNYDEGIVYVIGSNEKPEIRVYASSSADATIEYYWHRINKNSDLGSSGTDSMPESYWNTPGIYLICVNSKAKLSFDSRVFVESDAERPNFILIIENASPEYSDEIKNEWEGNGTEAEPWLLANQNDLEKLQAHVNEGISFEGSYFALKNDITLDISWTGIGGGVNEGNGKNMKPFSGTFDGQGHAVSFAEGTEYPLFTRVREAQIKNVVLYAPYNKCAALISQSGIDYGADGSYSEGFGGSYVAGCPDIADIDNVTLKSGSITSAAGLVSIGISSGGNIINISNCRIEKNVKVGWDKDAESPAKNGSIGGFIGILNGTISNSVCYADVYGQKNVGGFAGSKGQSMGPCTISNCIFGGSITATSDYVGGIIGVGYVATSSPNTPCVSVQNCAVLANIVGGNYVGGIFGGEKGSYQCWANGIGYIQDNLYFGKLSAGTNAVGSIIGTMNSLDRYNVIENNHYSEDCGATSPIGLVKYIDTCCEKPTEIAGVTYFNSSDPVSFEPIKQKGLGIDRTDQQRNDDPLGTDAKNLARPATAAELKNGTIVGLLNTGNAGYRNWVQSEDGYPIIDSSKVIATKLDIIGDYRTQYQIGDTWDMTGAICTVTYSNGTESNVDTADITFTGFDGTKRGVQTITATFGSASTQFTVSVLLPSSGTEKDNITVYFKLLGDRVHDSDTDGEVHTLENGGLQTWLPNRAYTLDHNATVWDLVQLATAGTGITCGNPSGNYVEDMTRSGVTIGEFTNGANSGWMYTLNGEHPLFGVQEQFLSDGDAIVWHYTDDWTQESGAEFLAQPDPNFSGSTKKDEKKNDAPISETTTQTATADDGSTVTTETEKTVETKENEDGSVTEVVTETTKTTVTAPDGSVSTTETAVETETTTNSVKNSDGTVTETEQTVEKVTETVTGADGKTQTTVTETEETKELNVATGADGKVSGTGTYSATSTVTVDGKVTSAVTEGTVAVSTDDKGTVSEVTTAKTTTTAPDGTKTETVTVITEAEMANGTTGKVVADEQGNTISAEATVSEAALEAAMKGDGVIEIPVTVNPASGAAVRISLEGATGDGKAWVEIGTTETAPGNVAYLKLADGVTKLLTTCKTGSVIVPVTGDCEVIVKDNSKSFSDVDGASWYGDSVKFVTAREIFNGVGNEAFAPGATMNRAMSAQILYNLDGSAKAGDGTSFSDVSADDWFNGAVGWASGLGVITGYNGAYAPLDAVTRQDLVTILYRYAKQAGYDVNVGSSVDLTSYADGAEVADYAAEAMRWAIAVGLVKGYEDNTLRPTATATRAEVAAIMQRMVQNAVK